MDNSIGSQDADESNARIILARHLALVNVYRRTEFQEIAMPKLVRVLTYTGPQEWLDMCVDNAFVALKQELGRKGDKSITSKWRDVKAQRRAQKIDDQKRRGYYMAARGGPQPRTHDLKAADEV